MTVFVSSVHHVLHHSWNYELKGRFYSWEIITFICFVSAFEEEYISGQTTTPTSGI